MTLARSTKGSPFSENGAFCMSYTCKTRPFPVGELTLVTNGPHLAASLWKNDKPEYVGPAPPARYP
ncbi:hypothetical protein [Pseudomonas sp. TH31]|uniref:hypothetical protein n=1 Tax=Pseudomonas sp. TH31 TaxID=2796396 RepID=UPI0019131CAB|nr:hypothetical protein [Pseudomonas sp. TH31]MBK5417914.1 hypothetical protein [Pseudomonas sp. TH31]